MPRTKLPEPSTALQLVGKPTRITIHSDLAHHRLQALEGHDDITIELKLLDNVSH
ncbi:MAG: hypothetical protein QM708_14005 [Propioniciclava sp.]|uniref:hypothetical protein n=1 Tax=Propioniciclava sp. TaxID=2038686 RepID=UPI0039E515F4